MSLVWPRPIATLREAYLSLALTVVYTSAHAQVHEKRDGAYVLRSSTVASVNIDADEAALAGCAQRQCRTGIIAKHVKPDR